MNEIELQAARLERFKAAIDKVTDGNKTVFGKKLGYKDGAFVRQMLSGERAITDKTVRVIQGLPGMKGWFNESAESTESTAENSKTNENETVNPPIKGHISPLSNEAEALISIIRLVDAVGEPVRKLFLAHGEMLSLAVNLIERKDASTGHISLAEIKERARSLYEKSRGQDGERRAG